MKRKACLFLVLCQIVLLALSPLALAHSGRTDAHGGHKDNQNKSGLGSYHYHCGGHPPHLHDGGKCPYASGASAAGESGAGSGQPTQAKASAGAPSPSTQRMPSVSEEMLAAYADSTDVRYGITNKPGINVRADASPKAARIHTIENSGTLVILLATENPTGSTASTDIWHRVLMGNGEEGYVRSDLIDEISREEALQG